MPHIFFYEATGGLNNLEISSHLKKSLSKTLSIYYPLAGRIVDNTHVNCNDEGVPFVEALADCKLLDVINKPIPQELDKLCPRNLDDVRDDVCVIVQTTFFKCGGLAIGIAFSHKLGDGWSSFLFFNCWAAISRGDDEAVHIRAPVFDGATLFPPVSDLGEFDPKLWFINENRMTKRFVFTASKINELRDKYTNTTRATRIEALSAFIWSRFLACAEAKADPKRSFIQLHAVNIRRRAVPPFPDELSGNFIEHAVPSLGDNEEGRVVEKMREAISNIDGDYVTKLREGTQSLDSLNDILKKYLGGELVTFSFSSICRFPVYEVDFGWGKPLWFGLGSSHHDIAIFLDSLSQGDIEAWITLKSEDMAKFEADQEFFAYAAT
jgi:shikimate O-hydroxycinnamoyltransferase